MTHLDDKRFASSSDSDALLPLKAASAYQLNAPRPKDCFPCRPFYSEADRLAKGLPSLFNDTRPLNKGLFLGDGFNGFLTVEVWLSGSVKAAVFQLFIIKMKQSGHDSGDHLKSTERQTPDGQPRSIGSIRNVLLTSATAVSLQPAASDVALDPNPG